MHAMNLCSYEQEIYKWLHRKLKADFSKGLFEGNVSVCYQTDSRTHSSVPFTGVHNEQQWRVQDAAASSVTSSNSTMFIMPSLFEQEKNQNSLHFNRINNTVSKTLSRKFQKINDTILGIPSLSELEHCWGISHLNFWVLYANWIILTLPFVTIKSSYAVWPNLQELSYIYKLSYI